MSDMSEAEMKQGFDPMAAFPPQQGEKAPEVGPITRNLYQIEENIDSQSYFLGEVPQPHLVDPSAFLPLDSDRLIGSVNMIEKQLLEAGSLIEEEVSMIQKHQKRIAFWEDRIEKNRALIKRNEFMIKQNSTEALYSKKNRDYWFGRAEEVEIDYSHAEVAARAQDWAWLTKKYGLKNADGTEIDPKGHCVEELCNGETKDLAAEYRNTAGKYEQARKDKEAANSSLVRENAKMRDTIDVLQGYIAAVYANDIEPLQEGVLLFKELGAKLKTLAQQETATYGDLRAWAESFLNDFIRTNPRVPQSVAINFRKITSIPLPPEYC